MADEKQKVDLEKLVDTDLLEEFFDEWMHSADVHNILKGDKGDKGDAFTYDDFTAAQIAALRKPADDAAREVNETKQTVDQWYTQQTSAWNNWFSDTLPEGVRKLWSSFWSNINTRWENFFGEEEGTPTKGVQKTWADWFAGRDTDWNRYKEDKDADWGEYKDAKNTNWSEYKQGKDTDWTQYKEDKDTDWSEYKQGKDTDWGDFLVTVNTAWNGTEDTKGLKKEVEEARDAASEGARLANEKAVLANDKAGLADASARNAQKQANYAKQQGDYAKRIGDYPDQIRSDGYVYSYNPEHDQAGDDGYYKTDRHVVAHIDPGSLTEEQQQQLISAIREDYVDEPVASATAMWEGYKIR